MRVLFGFQSDVFDETNKWQLAKGIGHVHAITDNKLVRALKAKKISFDFHSAFAGLF